MHDGDRWVVAARDAHHVFSGSGWETESTESPRFETKAQAESFREKLLADGMWEPKDLAVQVRR